MKFKRFLIFILLIQLIGCAKEVVYGKPIVESASSFKELGSWIELDSSKEPIKNDWWKLFNDQTLDQLELKIDDSNPNLSVYLARLEQSRAYTLTLSSQSAPNVNAIAQSTNNRQSDHRPLRGGSQPDVYGTNTLGLSIDYDLDLWGRIKALVSSGKSLEKASMMDLANARVGLQTELATNYFELCRFDAQVLLYQETIQSYEKQLKLTNQLHDQGVVSGLDVSRALAQLETIKGYLLVAESNRAKLEHSIAVLIGQAPSLFSIPINQLDGFKYPEIPVVLPSGLLERRPDIASAASKLASANANVGVAKTAYLPNVNLGLITGFQNSGSLGLITAPNLFWALGPSAVLNIFDSGKRDAQVKIALSKRDELASEYKLIVLKAFKDVEDSLTMLVSLNKQMVSAQNTQSAVKHSNSLVMNRYFEGIVSSFEVVKANDDLLNANEALLNIKINNIEARLALIHALGGGWASEN